MPTGILFKIAKTRKAAAEVAARQKKAAKVFGTYEQTPGAGIGHLEELIGAPYSERLKFTMDPRSSWDVGGEDRLYKALGYSMQPSRTMVGAFKPDGRKLEINPGMVARFQVPSEEGAISSTLRDMATVESARAYLDAQRAGAGHVVHAMRASPPSERTSLLFGTGASPTVEQMTDLDALASRYNFFPIDTGQGVSFMNNAYTDVGAARTGKDVKELMGQIEPEVGKSLPGYKMTPAKMSGIYEEYGGAYEVPGSGQATRKFLSDMEANPETAARIEPELMAAAVPKNERDVELSGAKGYALRDDILRARAILAKGGIIGLRHALETGVVLPAAVMAVLMPRQEEN